MTDPRDDDVLEVTSCRESHPSPSTAGPTPPAGSVAAAGPVAATGPDQAAGAQGASSGFGADAVHRITALLDAVPLRGRLLAILVVTLVAALLSTGYGVQLVLREYLVSPIDHQLVHVADVARRPNSPIISNLLAGRSADFPGITFIQLSMDDSKDQPLVTPAFGEGEPQPPRFPVLTNTQARQISDVPYDVTSTDGRIFRAVSFPVEVEDPTGAGNPTGPAAVTISQSLEDVNLTVGKLQTFLFLLGLALLLLCTSVGWYAIRRSFEPLIEVEETATAIAAGDLSRRIPDRPASTEVGRLTTSLNGMLTQIESAFRARAASESRTRRFAADASHELRTPLVSIRGFAELFRQGAVPPDDVPRTMRRIEDEAKRMGSLVEDLLLLARLDEQRPGRHDPVDLLVLAGDAVHDVRGLDATRPVRLVGLTSAPSRTNGTIDTNGTSDPNSMISNNRMITSIGGCEPPPGSAVVVGDEDRLRQVVANLVANAVRHTPVGTPIEVAVGLDGTSSAVLEVRDHGPGLSPAQVEKVFERFFRIDSSRQRGQGGGSGLGLSIVSAVVASHAGDVQVLQTPGGGATFRVSLPAAEAAADRPGTATPSR